MSYKKDDKIIKSTICSACGGRGWLLKENGEFKNCCLVCNGYGYIKIDNKLKKDGR